MTLKYSSLIALLFVYGTVAVASEWTDRIREIIPENVTLTEVVETDEHVNLAGEAQSTGDISALMRAIDQANLGSPELQQVVRIGDVSEFTLRVKARR